MIELFSSSLWRDRTYSPPEPWTSWDSYARCWACKGCGAAGWCQRHNPGCPDDVALASDRSGAHLSIAGTFRVYFNRHGAFPFMWIVAPAMEKSAPGIREVAFELAVLSVSIDAPTRTVYRPKSTPDDEDGRPSAWLETTGTLTVSADGHVRIA